MRTPRSIFRIRLDCDRISSISRGSLPDSISPGLRESRRLDFAKIDDRAFRFRNDLLGDGENDGTVDRLLVSSSPRRE